MIDFLRVSSRSNVSVVAIEASPMIFCSMNSATPSFPSLQACVEPVMSPRDPVPGGTGGLGPVAQKGNSQLPSG